VPAERVAARLRERYDVVFADPPYAQPYPAGALRALRERNVIDAHTTVVYEHSSREAPPADALMQAERSERYGEVALTFLRPLEAAA
jgi:16S rRNA G966 N2-methylase RsmD